MKKFLFCLFCLILTRCDYIDDILQKTPYCFDKQIKDLFNKIIKDNKSSFENRILLQEFNLYDNSVIKIKTWNVDNYVEETFDKKNKKRNCFAEVSFDTNKGIKKQTLKYTVSINRTDKGDMIYVHIKGPLEK